MLETTFATSFVPGSNVRGEVTGANWLFVLPVLELKHTLCLGWPAPTTLRALARVSRRLSLVLPDGLPRGSSAAPELSEVTLLPDTHALADGQIDLIYIAGRNGAAWLGRHAPWQRELERVLAPQGWLYCEGSGRLQRWAGMWAWRRLARRFKGAQLLWITPGRGEMQTAVPFHDRAMRRWFVRERLYAPSIDLRIFKHALRRSSRAAEEHAPAKAVSGGVRRRLRRGVWWLLSRAAHMGETGEHWLSRHHLMWGGQRHALVLGAGAAALATDPPAYLGAIAAAAGVDLHGARWGLSARGEYNSRKVIFFVQRGTASRPEYVVKMTRHAGLNYRLENEQRALSELHRRGLDRYLALPRVCFFGYHHSLAVLGETLVAGLPFEQCSRGQLNCRYARAAAEWLTRLGELTAEQHVAPALLAGRLEELLARLAAIYSLAPEHQRFLREQIERVRASQSPIPLVFQHGDPGTWNILVQPDGSIALLDWEAAEIQGVPLWDLLYFLRAFAVWSGRVHGLRQPLSAAAYHLLRPAAFHTFMVAAIAEYCRRLALDTTLIAPLFYTCWAHRALKEATRLPPDQVEQGHYIQLLRLCIDAAATPALQRIFNATPAVLPAAAGERTVALHGGRV